MRPDGLERVPVLYLQGELNEADFGAIRARMDFRGYGLHAAAPIDPGGVTIAGDVGGMDALQSEPGVQVVPDGTNGIDGDVLPVRIVDMLQDSLRVDHQTSDFGFTAFYIQLIPAGEA